MRRLYIISSARKFVNRIFPFGNASWQLLQLRKRTFSAIIHDAIIWKSFD